MSRLLNALLAATLLWCCTWARAQDIPVPALSGRVIDQTSTLTPAQHAALTEKLDALEKQTGAQLVVLIMASTLPEDIAAYAQRVGDQWKIGRRDIGDGLLLIVAKNDRRVRIEVAKTLEGAIPDLMARRIITEQITPAFKVGDYYAGIDAGVDKLSALVKGEKLPAPSNTSSGRNTAESAFGESWPTVAMFFFVAVPIIGAVLTTMLGRKFGSLATGGAVGALGYGISQSGLMAGAAAVLALILVGVMGVGSRRSSKTSSGLGGAGPAIWGAGGYAAGSTWGRGSSSSSGGSFGSGGGFSSGGGGDFGGGGASGDW